MLLLSNAFVTTLLWSISFLKIFRALKILRNEIDHKRVVTNAFDRSSIGLYDDIYSTPGQKKFYVVKDVLEKFTSKVGQFVEIMDLEEFGHALFIDHDQ